MSAQPDRSRRLALAAMATLAAWPPLPALGKQVARVGLLWNSVPQTALDRGDFANAGPGFVVQALHEKGWIVGRNLELVSISAEGRFERFPAIVDAMLRQDVEVIAVFSPDAERVVRARAPRIPVVFAVTYEREAGRSSDGATGMVASDPIAKRFEIVRALLPSARRVCVVFSVSAGAAELEMPRPAVEVSRRMGIDLASVTIRSESEAQAAYAEAKRRGADALFVNSFPELYWHADVRRGRLDLAMRHRLPAVYDQPELVPLGALVAIGPEVRETHARTGYYIDRILRGTPVAELPMEAPRRHVLHVNRRTAEKLGITLPPSLLLMADAVFD